MNWCGYGPSNKQYVLHLNLYYGLQAYGITSFCAYFINISKQPAASTKASATT
jgi:hypothetical protein